MKNKISFVLILIANSFNLFAQENVGFICVNSGTSLEPISFENTISESNGFLYTVEILVYNLKKQKTHKIISTNNRMTGEITLFSENLLTNISKSYNIRYTTGECGLIFIPDNLIDTTIDIKQNYTFVVSFKDIEYKTPFVNKIKTGEDEYLELERLSKILLKKHKDLSTPLIAKREYEKESKRIKNAMIQEESEQKRRLDSIKQEKKNALDKIKAEQFKSLAFQDLLIEDGEKMIVKFIFDSIKISKINAAISDEYKNRLNNKGFISTSNDSERYSGDLIRRKKIGAGFLVVNDVSFYYGYFENDSFSSGQVIERKSKISYVGNIKNKLKDGIGRFQLSSGDFFLGNFSKGDFIGGFSQRTLEDGSKYFGAFSNNKPNGFGFLNNQNSASSIGNFNNGILETGYEFRFLSKNKILTKKCINFNCSDVEIGEYVAFANKLNAQFSKVYSEFNYSAMENIEKPNSEPEVVSQKTLIEQWRLTTKKQMFNVKTKAPIAPEKTKQFFALSKKRPWKGRYTVRLIKTEYDNENIEYKVIDKNLIRANMFQLGFTFQMVPIAKYQNSNLNAFKFYIPQVSLAWKYFGAFYGYGIYTGDVLKKEGEYPTLISSSSKETYLNQTLKYHEGGLLINLGGPIYLKGGFSYLNTETINYSFTSEYFNKRFREEYGFVAGLSFMPMGFIAELGYNHTFRSIQAGIGFNIPFKL